MEKKKRKQIVHVLSCAMASILIFYYLCMVLSPKSSSDMFAARVFQGSGFKNEPENSLDLMVFGNSDAYAGIIPAKIYSDYGYTSYVCGKSLQTIENAKEMLDEAYKTQSPAIVILETDCLYEENKINVDESKIYLSPFIFHCRWKELNKRDFRCLTKRQSPSDYTKGYIDSDAVFNCKVNNYMGNVNDPPHPIFPKAKESLDSFIKECEENGSKLIFLELPSPCSWGYSRHNYIQSIADEHSIEFIDLNVPNDNYPLDVSTDFRDDGNHLNRNGAEKATEYLSKYIYENYSSILTDKRDSGIIGS